MTTATTPAFSPFPSTYAQGTVWTYYSVLSFGFTDDKGRMLGFMVAPPVSTLEGTYRCEMRPMRDARPFGATRGYAEAINLEALEQAVHAAAAACRRRYVKKFAR
jgi:hypothetical protein